MLILSSKENWQKSLSELITDPAVLFEKLALDPAFLKEAYTASALFPLRVTSSFVQRMKKADINDPLLLQVLPLGIEKEKAAGFSPDPLLEKNVNPVSGLLHKYPGRVLVTLTGACAVHCRYCFRRHFSYAQNNPGRSGRENIFSYIQANETITEVILSGGDPLSVPDKLLEKFIKQLSSIKHIKTLRIHTRLPIVLPERITDALVTLLGELKVKVVIVLHANHAQEINDDVKSAINKLRHADITLLNQSVLLRNINDNVQILADLSHALFDAGVIPYYLHLLDKVQGAHHFDIPILRAKELHQQLRNTLPGYLVPRLVQEEAGELSKTLIL